MSTSTLSSEASTAASVTSAALDMSASHDFVIVAVFAGSAAGTIKLQGSHDGSTYVDIASSSQTISGADTVKWVNDSFSDNFVRAVFTRSSGTGTVTITSYAKITPGGR